MDGKDKTTADGNDAMDDFLERTRRSRRVNKIVWCCIAAPFALLWLFMIPPAFLSGFEGLFMLVISAIPLTIIFYIARAIDCSLANKIRNKTANTLLPDIAKEFFGPSATFERKRGIPVAHLKESGFFPRGRKFKTTDMVMGVRNGIPVAFSDAEVSHTEGVGEDDSETVYDFGGLWVMCRMPRPIDGSLRLIEGCGGYHNATGDASFDTKFGVEESAQGVANTILTPECIKSILNTEWAAGGILLVWVSGWDMHIAVDFHADLFEGMGDGKKSTAKKGVPDKDAAAYKTEFRKEMRRVASIVDEITKNELFGTPATEQQLPPNVDG
jgi:hypothetical protein